MRLDLFEDLNAVMDKVHLQMRIWKLERAVGMNSYSLSFWEMDPDLGYCDNLAQFRKYFSWNARKRRWEDEFFRSYSEVKS